MQSALKQPARAQLTQNGLELHGGTPDELRRFVATESEKWRALIKNANIKAT